MPEKPLELASDLAAVRDWIYDVKGGEFKANLYPGTQHGLWSVDGEPIVIFPKSSLSSASDMPETKSVLLCSDKHAHEMEATGVLKFSEDSVQP